MCIIYIHKIYRNSKLFANPVTYCLHYVYILINTLVHGNTIYIYLQNIIELHK